MKLRGSRQTKKETFQVRCLAQCKLIVPVNEHTWLRVVASMVCCIVVVVAICMEWIGSESDLSEIGLDPSKSIVWVPRGPARQRTFPLINIPYHYNYLPACHYAAHQPWAQPFPAPSSTIAELRMQKNLGSLYADLSSGRGDQRLYEAVSSWV